MKRTHYLALSVLSGLLLATTPGCSGPAGPPPRPSPPATSAPPRPTSTPAATTAPATPGATATPGTSATPGASGTPGAATGGEDGFEKASGQPGYDDVKKIGKNPMAGDAAALEKGKALFAQNCVSCHGAEGKGDGEAGAALDPKPRNLTVKSEYKYGTGDLALFRTIKYGIQGSGMAPWDGRMSDEECWQAVNFAKTLLK